MAKIAADQAVSKKFTANEAMLNTLAMNATTLRREVIQKLLDPAKDIDQECGYPTTISSSDYRAVFDREGLGTRLVEIWPEECWSVDPQVYETEDANETEFERVWSELAGDYPIFHYLLRADVLSGIGRFGVILLGVDDGRDLSLPLDGVEPDLSLRRWSGRKRASKLRQRQLIFLKTLDETLVEIKQFEKDPSSPRFGFPTLYSLKLEADPGSETTQDYVVHWTRVIHVADNCLTSEIYGVPRLQNVYNHLRDVKKVGGGSGEMFWRGGFPGYSFELTPEAQAAGAQIDTASVKEQMTLWTQGLQRWFSLTGVTAKSLSPQVANPLGHVEMFVKLMGMAKGIPWRLLLGTEEAKLASTQDKKTWNSRLMKRQNKYVTPKLVRPFVERLIMAGVLPEPQELHIEWPDMNAPSSEDTAKVANVLTEAMAKYVGGNVDQMLPPREYLIKVCGFTEDECDAIEKALDSYVIDNEPEEEEGSVEVEDLEEDD